MGISLNPEIHLQTQSAAVSRLHLPNFPPIFGAMARARPALAAMTVIARLAFCGFSGAPQVPRCQRWAEPDLAAETWKERLGGQLVVGRGRLVDVFLFSELWILHKEDMNKMTK